MTTIELLVKSQCDCCANPDRLREGEEVSEFRSRNGTLKAVVHRMCEEPYLNVLKAASPDSDKFQPPKIVQGVLHYKSDKD